MNKKKSHQLNHFLNNKTLGSSELVRLLNDYLTSILKSKTQIIYTIRLAKTKLGHFEAINSYLSDISSILKKDSKDELRDFLMSFSSKENEKIEAIFDKVQPKLEKVKRVITLSRSGTVLSILKLLRQKNKNLQVIVCESRPKQEGRLFANDLAQNGIKVEFITDAMMALYVPKIDVALTGADRVLKNTNVINKVGSKALAVLCKEYKKPFYVVSTLSKLSKEKSFKQKQENSKEIWDHKLKNLSISNIYFEEIEKRYITKIFTE